MVKNLPPTQLGSIPGYKRPPGEEMATHSSIIAWKISWTEEPGGLQSIGLQKVRHDRVTNTQWVHTNQCALK